METGTCPKCQSKNIIKKGIRKNKFQSIQVYKCKGCKAIFSPGPAKNITYPVKIILNAISYYNLGYSQQEVSKIIAKRFKIRVPQRTISSWIRKFKEICRFSRMRSEVIKHHLKHHPKNDLIFSKKFYHQQVYDFQYHKAKLELSSKELPEQKFRLLKSYIEKIPTKDFPHHIFGGAEEGLEKRASQLSMNLLKMTRLQKKNYANMLAEIALKISPNNRARHETIQKFMLINDSVTIATEVPVYLTANDIEYFKGKGFTLEFENYRTPITGHIDILQIRNGLIHILDYKPEASKTNPVQQLTIYALALASRTKLAVKDFKCAWFDDKGYYEFFPLHAVYVKVH